MKKALVLAGLILLGACSSEPERVVQKVEGNVVFRLGAKPDGVEIRLESSFYPTSGYELVTRTDGTAADITAGITITLEGVRVPLEATGDRSPASAVVFLPVGQSVDGISWALKLRIPIDEKTARTDSYVVKHGPAGWKLSTTQGGFSRFEQQGSY